MSPEQTKTDREMENRMLAVAGDAERVEVINRARTFKRSWLELAEALTRVYDRKSWERWGHESFDSYCKKELHVNSSTAQKLLGSFRFLKTTAPKVLERARGESEVPIPSQRAVEFVARAEERGAADNKTLTEIRRAAFDEGADAPLLSRRFKTVAFPVSAAEKREKSAAQLVVTAKKLASLLSEPDLPISHEVAAHLEEAIGRVLAEIDSKNLPN